MHGNMLWLLYYILKNTLGKILVLSSLPLALASKFCHFSRISDSLLLRTCSYTSLFLNTLSIHFIAISAQGLLYIKCGPATIESITICRIDAVTIASWTTRSCSAVKTSAYNTMIRIVGLNCPIQNISCHIIYVIY